ncbi:toxin VasX [Pseudoalteromonas luteoviolacea]|nr:toxin VasX [Pseudoalteromonas luteoviolacea]AOT10967.1 hypothetical protein S4054249_24315 [Pseudoalteromonas luteoviolacea]AOT15869.1 hypothetical protein S40542_24195 [Pseudoalteromonas luteoviolacea]AOT20788.1 hypothetical protein S4054_24235 [Pseudoalteromonas luteoviolacea]
MTSTAPTSVNEQGAYRELVFEGYASDSEQVSLMIKDYSEDQAKTGFYKIPLGFANTTQNNNNADVELVYIYPLCECTPDGAAERKLTNLRPGYLYIYVDGHLWRELEVTEHEEEDISYFKDVNLAYQKGPQAWRIDEHGQVGERVATGEQLKQVLVPNKLYGQPCQVEIAFSETQWCWRQIEAFGGMSENDPRLNYGPSVKPGTNDDAASERRSQRMQVLDKLGNYAQGYSNDEAPQHIPLPRMPKNGLHRPVLKDPIGVARYLAAEIVSERKNIQQLSMESIKGASLTTDDFEDFAPEQKNISKHVLATTIQSQFFAFPNTTQQKVDLGMSVSEHEQDMAQNYKSWVRAGFSKYEFRRYLKTEQALTSARAINVQKSFGFDHITREDEPMSFYQAVKDYGYYEDVRRNFVYELISDVTAPYTDLTKTLIESFLVHDSDFRAAKQIDEEDMGQELMLKVLGTHPLDTENAANSLKLTALMYPKKTGTALSDYECARRESSDPFDTVFSVELQQQIQQDIDEGIMSGEQREFWRRASHVVWGVLAVSFSVPTSYYAAGGSGKDFKAHSADRNTQEERLRSQRSEIQKEIDNLHDSIALKQQEISARQAANAQVRQELQSGLFGEGKSIPDSMDQILANRMEELEALHDNHSRARARLIRTKQNLKLLHQSGEYYQGRSFRDLLLREVPHTRYMHLAKVMTGDLLTEIDIDVNDYYSNKLPDGKVPLNFLDKAKRAQESLLKLERAAEGFDSAYESPQTDPLVKAKIDEFASIEARLDHILELDGSLDEVLKVMEKQQADIEAGQTRIKKTLVVMDLSAVEELKTAIEENFDKIENNLVRDLEIEWQLKGFSHENEALSKMARMNINPATLDAVLRNLLPVVAILEVANLYSTINDPNAPEIAKLSAILDTADIMSNIGLNMVERKIGLPSPKQCYAIIRSKPVPPSALTKRFWWSSQLKFKVYGSLAANALTFVASAVSTYVAYNNMISAYERGDGAQVLSQGLMMTGAASMTLSSLLGILAKSSLVFQSAALVSLASGLAIAGVIILLIGAGIAWAFSEEPIEAWLEACHWGKSKTRFKNDDSHDATIRAAQWEENPELALHDLYNTLYRPNLSITSINVIGSVKFSFSVPLSYPENGAKLVFMYKKQGDDDFSILSRYQISQMVDTIELYPNRTGWEFTTTYSKIKHALGVQQDMRLEFKVLYAIYPRGVSEPIIHGTKQEFVLPIRFERKKEESIQQRHGGLAMCSFQTAPTSLMAL